MRDALSSRRISRSSFSLSLGLGILLGTTLVLAATQSATAPTPPAQATAAASAVAMPPVPVTVVAPTSPPKAAAAAETEAEFVPSVMWVLIVVPVLQWAKTTKNPLFGWVSSQSMFWISGAVALAGQIGIHYTYDALTGTLVITGLTHQALGIVSKWASQHVLYKGLKAMDAVSAVAESLAKPGIGVSAAQG